VGGGAVGQFRATVSLLVSCLKGVGSIQPDLLKKKRKCKKETSDAYCDTNWFPVVIGNVCDRVCAWYVYNTADVFSAELYLIQIREHVSDARATELLKALLWAD
jgi:hypothetical protein